MQIIFSISSQAGLQSFDKLKSVAMRESLFGTNHVNIRPNIRNQLNVDSIANWLLSTYTFELHHKAAVSTGNSDCLFNATSTLLVGDESLSAELRYKSCIKMIQNSEQFLDHPERSSFCYLAPDYDEACKSCAYVGKTVYSCVWTIIALVNVIQVPIQMIYPAVNGCKDLAYIKLNTILVPETIFDDVPIKIMWTAMGLPQKGKTWTPDHFVPIVPDYSESMLRTVCDLPISSSTPAKPIDVDDEQYTPLSEMSLESEHRNHLEMLSENELEICHEITDSEVEMYDEIVTSNDQCDEFVKPISEEVDPKGTHSQAIFERASTAGKFMSN